MLSQKFFYHMARRAIFALLVVFSVGSAFAACSSNQIDVNGNGSQCEDVKFEATVDTSDYDEFSFSISAIGTFYISCGGGGNAMVDWDQGSPADYESLDDEWTKVVHTTADTVVYKCGFDIDSTTHKVRIGGTATGYASSASTPAISFYTPGASNAAMITALSGDLSSVFPKISSSNAPRFYQTFRGTTNLHSVPATLFASYNTSLVSNMFYGTFRGSGLTSIPENLFSGLSGGTTGAFKYTFYGCSSLNHIGNYNYIPGTFLSSVTGGSDIGTNMFASTGFGSSCPSGTYSVTRSNFSGIGKPWCSPGSTITYNMNGGSNYGDAPSYYIHGTGVTIDGTPTRSGYFFDGWTGSNGSTPQLTVTIGPNETGAKSYTANWGGPKFTITTSSTDSFQFKLSPKGTFVVDCGNNGTLSGEGVSGNKITKTDTSVYTYTCTWGIAGVQTIGFGGFATEYSTDSTTAAIGFNIRNDSQQDENIKKIDSISGSLGAIFGTTANGQQPRFYRTFFAAVNLGEAGKNSIPTELFYGIHGTPVTNMFKETFSGSSLYGEIPETLFCENPSNPTADDCIMGEPAAGMFQETFYGCSGLNGIKTGSTTTYYVPSTFLSALNISSAATNPAQNMLYGTGLASSCPAGTYTVTPTNFSNAGKPWCSPCAAGTYTNSSGQNSCSVCPADTYVTTTGATSCTSCAAGYGTTGNTAAGHDSASDCTAKTYTITYKAGEGGVGNDVTQSATYMESVTLKPADTFSKPNATFNKWSLSLGGTLNANQTISHYNVTQNITLTATWTCNTGYTLNSTTGNCDAKTYTVVYNSNKPSAASGTVSGTMSNSSHTYGTAKALTTNAYSLPGYVFKGWSTSSTATTVTYQNGQSVNNLTSTNGGTVNLYAVWEAAKFTVTTTSTNSFQFSTTAAGTFYVDCGNGGTLSGTGASGNTITKTSTAFVVYTCSWGAEAVQTVKFSGAATGYSSNEYGYAIRFNVSGGGASDENVKKLASISGSLGAIFGTVANPTPSGTISQPKFPQTFAYATNLTGTIPEELFYGIHGQPVVRMFNATFQGCSGLTGSIPETLFCENTTNPSASNCIYGAPAANMFYATFYGCSGLTSIKDGSTTTAYVPGTFLSAITDGTATTPVQYMFTGTGLSSSCPAGTYTVTPTNFSNAGKPWCSPCAKGTYTSSGGQNSCSVCPADTYVTTTGATSCTSCAAGYGMTGNTAADHDSASDCTAKTYTVTYKAGEGGVGNDVTQSATYMQPFTTKPADTFSKPNATFNKWSANVGGNLNANQTISNYNVARDITLTATWTCNTGYTLNSSTGNCDARSITCDAGYYLNASTTQCTACPAGKYCSGGTFTYNGSNLGITGDISAGYFASGGAKVATPTSSSDCLSGNTCGQCTSDSTTGRKTYSTAGAASCSVCPAVTGSLANRVTSYSGWWRNDVHDKVTGCAANFSDTDADATFTVYCYYNTTDGGYGGANSVCQVWHPSACAAGTYDTIESTTEWNWTSSSTYARGQGVDFMNGKVCTPTTAGYYSAEGAKTQTICPANSYCKAGSSAPTACSSLGGGLYTNSAAGSDAASDCYLTTTAGKYIANSTDTAQTDCPGGKYCVATTLNYPNVNTPADCPAADSSHKWTTGFPDDFYNPTEISYALSTSTKRTKITSCTATYTATNARGQFKFSAYYNTTTGKYDDISSNGKYYSVLNAGYYGTTKYYDNETCNSSITGTTKMYYKEAQPCPAGSYCPGISSMPKCNTGTYNDTIGKNACANSTYTNTTGQSTCTPCATGYSNTGTGNTSCTPNQIAITWDGVTSQTDLAANVRYVTYGGDIHTPSSSNIAQQTGAQLVGWKFKKS